MATLCNDHVKRYSRQLIVPQFGLAPQISLRDATLLLVGCGGLGSSAAFYLASAGVGKIHLVDGDVVERSNLHRQIIHTEAAADANIHKVESAAAALRNLNSTCTVIPHSMFITCENALSLVEQVDVVVDGTDNVATRYILSDACVLAGKTLVSGAAIGMDGQATVYNYQNKGPCYRCRFPTPPKAAQSCSDAGVLGPVPGLIGVLLAMETIKIISGVGKPLSERMYHYDALEGRSMVFQLPGRQENCMCGRGSSGGGGGSSSGGGSGGGGSGNRTMEETRCFLEEHCLSSKEGSKDEEDGTQQLCPRESSQTNKEEEGLKALHCISCLDYQHIREATATTSHVLLDVRAAHQFAICALPGAINIPLAQLESRMQELRDKGDIYVMCRRGVASIKGTTLLLLNHFDRVRNVNGGLDAWKIEVDTSLPMY